jgi:two-component system, OmpR family, sensor kinase
MRTSAHFGINSIRRRLLLWLLSGVLFCSLAAGLGVYLAARAQVGELFDGQLRQVAATFPSRLTTEGDEPEPVPRPDPSLFDGGDGGLVIQVWDHGGTPLYASRSGPLPPQIEVVGMGSIPGQTGLWRTYTVRRGERFIQVARPAAARHALAAAIATRSVLPLLLLLVLLGGLIWVGVDRGLRPLGRLARTLSECSPEAMPPLQTATEVDELRPMVEAINVLLARLHRALEAHRALVADAAHELRTPLTALKLQLQLAERSVGEGPRAAAFAKVHERLDRTTRLITQLLTLARLEPGRPPQTQVDLADLVRVVVGDFTPLARERGVALSLNVSAEPTILGEAESLRTLLNNLVDNALRLTPADGQVTLSCAQDGGGPVVTVSDTGPGIPAAARERVFDRFYRHLGPDKSGSGLGLAIVRRIATDHGAVVTLTDPPAGTGLVVTVQFPGRAG